MRHEPPANSTINGKGQARAGRRGRVAKRLENAIITNADYLSYIRHPQREYEKYKNIGIDNYELVADFTA